MLENRWLSFTFEPVPGNFGLKAKDGKLPGFQGAILGLNYCLGRHRISTWSNDWGRGAFDELKGDLPPCALNGLSFHALPDHVGLRYRVDFALSERHPMLFWRVIVDHQGNEPVHIDSIELLRIGNWRGHSPTGRIDFHTKADETQMAFFSNGWQSWSITAAYGAKQAQIQSRLQFIQSPLINFKGTPITRRKGHFSSDFFGVLGDRYSRRALLVGFLSQREQFGSVETMINDESALRIWANGDSALLNPGTSIRTDWAVAYPFSLDEEDPLAPYLGLAAEVNQTHLQAEIPVGWCSWYHFYQDVTAGQIRENLAAIITMQPELPLELVQIDDGFESQVGDWFGFQPVFPDGVAPLAREIKEAGLTPGGWLAPFIVHPRSNLMKQHPEFLLRNKAGRPVNAGFVWNVFNTALDLTNPGALDYACRVVKTAVEEWGFHYLKLDFLYAAALAGEYQDPTKTRAQVMHAGMRALREAAGSDTFILGCGAPLGAAIGWVDAMRIGSDVSGSWLPEYFGISSIFKKEPSMPSTRNAIQNALTRAFLHKHWWINDADCLLIRQTTKLTLPEVQTLASVIALTGGALLLSDDLHVVAEERFRIAKVLYPLIGERARVVDWFDRITPERLRLDMDAPPGDYHLVAWFNWSEKERDFTLRPSDYMLPAVDYWARSFWDEHSFRLRAGYEHVIKAVPPHGCVVLALRQASGKGPVYLGSNLHISQGMEINRWEVGECELAFVLDLGRRAEGTVECIVPGDLVEVMVEGERAPWRKSNIGGVIIPVKVDKDALVKITFQAPR